MVSTTVSQAESYIPTDVFILNMIIYLLNTVNPNHSYIPRFNRYPIVNIKMMGFPAEWENESLWNQKKEETTSLTSIINGIGVHL